MNELVGLVDKLDVGEPIKGKRVTFYPLRLEKKGKELDYLTLDEALADESLEVIEKGEAGEVPELRVHNRSQKKILLVDGEELIGAKQNRILNTTILLKSRTKTVIPVSCVEAGRWHYRARRFSSGSYAYTALRRKKVEQVTASLRRERKFRSDQQDIWDEVDRKMALTAAYSPTAELHQAYLQKEEELREYVKNVKLPEDSNGVVVAIGGRLWAVDLFDKPATFKKLWSKLSIAYAMDALEEEMDAEPPSVTDAKRFLSELKKAKFESFDSVGLGKDVRIESTRIVGSALLYRRKVVHLSVFDRSIGAQEV